MTEALLSIGQSLRLDSLPSSGEPLPLSLWAKQTSGEQLRGTSYSLPPSREPALSRPAKSQKRYGSLSVMGKERQEEGTWGEEGRSVLIGRKHWKHRRRKLSTQGYSPGAGPALTDKLPDHCSVVMEPGDLGKGMRTSYPPSGRGGGGEEGKGALSQSLLHCKFVLQQCQPPSHPELTFHSNQTGSLRKWPPQHSPTERAVSATCHTPMGRHTHATEKSPGT